MLRRGGCTAANLRLDDDDVTQLAGTAGGEPHTHAIARSLTDAGAGPKLGPPRTTAWQADATRRRAFRQRHTADHTSITTSTAVSPRIATVSQRILFVRPIITSALRR